MNDSRVGDLTGRDKMAFYPPQATQTIDKWRRGKDEIAFWYYFYYSFIHPTTKWLKSKFSLFDLNAEASISLLIIFTAYLNFLPRSKNFLLLKSFWVKNEACKTVRIQMSFNAKRFFFVPSSFPSFPYMISLSLSPSLISHHAWVIVHKMFWVHPQARFRNDVVAENISRKISFLII